MFSLVHILHANVILVRCVKMLVSGLEADPLLTWMMHVWRVLRRRGMMGFSPQQPECQIVDCEAAYYDGDGNNLHGVVKHFKNAKERANENERTIALSDIGSMKLLTISANMPALSLDLPTLYGSRCIHFSQLLHTVSMAGTLLSRSHLFSLNSRAQTAISASISDDSIMALSVISLLIVEKMP